MPRDGQGNYNPPLNNWNPAVDGNEADPAGWNELRDDITSALSQSVSSDGQTMMTGNLRMGGNQIQNLGQPMGNGFALRRDQLIKGPNIPSASTINIPVEGSLFEVTGTSTINQITGSFDGRVVVLVFQDVLTIKHSPSLDLPGQRDIKTEPKDSLTFYRKDSLSWSCINLGINAANQPEVDAGENDAKFVTPKTMRFGFAFNIGTSGYIVFPSWLRGFIIQWGAALNTNELGQGYSRVYYPIPFPNYALNVLVSADVASPAFELKTSHVQYAELSASDFVYVTYKSDGAPNPAVADTNTRYIAIGR